MGRTTNNGLTSANNSTDFARGSMAPQKIWNVETLMPCNFETAANSIDEILLDIKKNALHLEFEEMIGSSVQKGLCSQVKAEMHSHREVTSEFLNLHSVVDNDTKKRERGERQSLLLKDMLVGDYHDNTTLSVGILQNGKVTDKFITDVIFLDHSYAHSLWQPHDMWFNSRVLVKTEDDSNHSTTCSNPKLRLEEQDLTSCTEFSKNYMGFKPLSPASSTSSLAADLASSSSYSILSGDESDDMLMGTSSPVLPSSDLSFTNSPSTLSQKRKQFKAKILTPLERNHLHQHRFLNHKRSIGIKPPIKGLNFKTDSNRTDCSLNSDSVFPIGSSSSLDWDRSESETLNGFSDTEVAMSTFSDDESSTTERLQSVFHDHDYCSKVRFDGGLRKLTSLNIKDNIGMFKDLKRKYTKRNKINGLNEKILKAKYLKKELLKRDSSLKPVLNRKPTFTGPAVAKPNLKSVGRQRKRVLNKITDAIHPETEKKLKITGKFQDQYVYYLSKSSRTSSRGRQTASSLTSDKNLASGPKPGDIVIPHLTDADIEAVRLKGRSALKQPARPHCTNSSSHPMPFQSVGSFSDNSVEHMYDVDSHIVSTILSMESDNVSYPASPAPVISTSLNSMQSADNSVSDFNPSQSADIINTSPLSSNQTTGISTSNLSPSQPADVINTSSLNPNQPALTESLQLMSGDPTITSEHVLNYLLSLMKDDGFTDSGCGSETGSVFFPPLSSESINMADQAVRTEEVFCGDNNIEIVSPGGEFLDMMNCVEITSSDEILHHGAHNDSDHRFHPSQGDCGTDATLLDDLSLMLESKEVLFPPGNLHRDCSIHSVKKTFKPDSSVQIPQVTSSVDKLRSIEKTIDYLYRKDEFFDHTLDESSSVTTPIADDTPWIVTITLYFNDLPAIMINNQPYIRLVDIYKQILPAKDTGILKKRCQLLNIPILSCTEMQRYFLVQYGKACNSKSTIIVSKIHAADLIAYYTTPQSRAGRLCQEQKIQSDTSQKLHTTSRTDKHKSKRSKKSPVPESFSVSEDPGKLPCIQNDAFNICEILSIPRGKQKKHKKAHYLGLLNGRNNEKSTATKAFESVLKSTSSQTSNKHSVKMSGKLKHSKEDLRKSCSYIQQNREIKHIHRVEKKHNKKDINGKLEMKLPTEVFSNTDRRTSYHGLPQKNKHHQTVNVKYEVKKPKKCKHKKSGLSSHHNKDSTTSATAGRSIRTLSVRHQPVFEDGIEPQLPPQAADLYIDLFVRPDSACLRCVTCAQFLSVSHFMNHHHVPNDSELLASEAAQRILVPLVNNMNMSKPERHLWRKFQRLQKTIGSSERVDDGKCNKYQAQNVPALPQASSSSLLHTDQSLPSTSNKRKRKYSTLVPSASCHDDDNPDSLRLRQKFSPTCIPSVSSNHKHPAEANSDLVSQNNTQKSKLLAESTGAKMSTLRSGRLSETNAPSARTSTRKRKSKQFFSIENY